MTRASLRSDPRLRGRGRHRSPWTPRRLRPRAWYDAELGQPKYVGYVQLNGGSTDNISVPDTAFNSFSNDIEVIMRVRPDDWTTGAIQTLCGKYLTTGNQRSWRFYISATGTIGLTASVDGTAVTTVLVTPSTPFVDATWIWLRLRLDLTNGANSVGTIDTAADTGNNYTIPTSWTANGTATGTTISGIFNGTGLVEIGAFSSGTSERFAGRVGRCIVKSGFDGVVTSDFNADNCYGPGYSSVTTLPVDTNGYAHVPLSGITGDYIIGPNLNLTGNINARIRTRYTATVGTLTELIGDRLGTTGEFAFRYNGATTGLICYWYEAGVAVQAFSGNHNIPVDTDVWFGCERINSVSGGNYRVRFYSSTALNPSLTSWSDWTMFSEVNGAAIAAPTASTQTVTIGGTAQYLRSNVYRALLSNADTNAIIADFNASLSTVDGQVDAYGNQWLINQSKYLGTWTLGIPKIYDRSSNNVAPAVFGSGTNQPRYLVYNNTARVELPGVVGNNISTSRAKGTVNTSMQYVYRIDDMAPPSSSSTAISWGGSGAYGPLVYHGTDLRPRVFFGVTPQDTGVMGTAPPTGVKWWRITWTLATGVVTSEYSVSDVTNPNLVVWVSHASYSGVADIPFTRPAENIKIGEVAYTAANPNAGKVVKAQIYIDNVLVADFDAAQCGQSGYTDSLGNVWTVNRATTGRKTVVQSGAAKSARSVILFGTDDYITVPAAAVSFPATQADPLTIGLSTRQWATTVSAPRLFDSRSGGLASGIVIRCPTATSFDAIGYDPVGGGAFITPAVSFTYGLRNVLTLAKDVTSALLYLNRVAGSTNVPGAGDVTSASDANIGRQVSASLYWDGEFEALWLRTSKESAIDHSRAVEYYNGGL